jgi:DNA-binding transcriptional ArsR family regulator
MTHHAPDPDRANAIRLDPRNLKGLAHPLRLRLLGLLREDGPATASMLAARLGESSGATSYHLRQLEGFGFITEDAERGTGRDRWWRAAHQNTCFDESSLSQDPESRMLGAEFLRAIVGAGTDRALRWIEALPNIPEPWNRAGTLSDWGLRLTPEQAQELGAELQAVIERYPRHDPERPAPQGTANVSVLVQILPRVSS